MIPSWYNTVLFQMLDAVAFLHSMHIMVVNRDINPTNILFSKNDSFILAGFSLARVGIPRPGEYWEVRDQRYLPPEVHKRRAERTAVDIWALGILCLDMLNMLPKVGVNEDTNDPALFRQLNWCGRMSALASRTGRPELQTTVVKEVEQRISATLLRQRMKRHSGTWPRSFRPSLSLLHVLMREDSTYSHLNEEEIVPYAGRYLEDHPSMSQPSTSASQRTINPHQQPSPYQQPRSPYQQPRSPYQQPISPYQQPISPFQHPQSPFQQPILPFQQPIFPFQQPISPYQQPMSPYQQPISLYHQTMGFQSTARAEMIARTGAQELADLPLRRLYILRQEMERPGLDSRIGMQAFRGSEGITAPSTSTTLPFPATLAQAAAESRSATNRPRGGRSKGKQAEAKAKQKEGEAGIRLGEAKAGATATEEKAEAMATGTKPEATGTEVNVAPSKLTSGRDLRLGRSSEERPTVRGATSGSGSAKASPLAKSQPTERQGQSPRITEILSRKGDAKAQSRSPSSRNLATSSFHGVEQVSQPQQRDRARPGPSSDSSRQVQTRIGQRQVKDEQPTTLSAPPPPSRGRSAGSTGSVITQPRPSQESSPSSVKSKPDSSEGEAEAR
jgi:Protein kinase domain